MLKKTIIASIITIVIIFSYLYIIWIPPNKDIWIGYYDFGESYPGEKHGYVISYLIYIYKEDGEYYANIDTNGWMSGDRFKANVVGDGKKIDILFNEERDDSIFTSDYYHKGDLLLSFSIGKGVLYTTWHKMQSNSSLENGESKGIYFEKVSEDELNLH